jgi:hypothetical protein
LLAATLLMAQLNLFPQGSTDAADVVAGKAGGPLAAGGAGGRGQFPTSLAAADPRIE